MARPAPLVEHLLRRAGFGLSPGDAATFSAYPYPIAVTRLMHFDATANPDDNIGRPGFVGVTARGAFRPDTRLDDARQRWLFRMIHTPSPLQEKMTLFWHHHFATAHSKIATDVGSTNATRLMAARPTSDVAGQKGQIEMLREYALGNFRALLVEVAKDPAMLYWLDGRLNTRRQPQENFGRELMELFTIGVDNHTEDDVYSAARVFTGWNLSVVGRRTSRRFDFAYRASQHDTDPKEFSFAIYPDGNRRIPGRSSSQGMQDGLDLINALALHPETARRMAGKLWEWFVSEFEAPAPAFVDRIANVYLSNDTEMRPVLQAVLTSPEFLDSRYFFHRYGWPVEFVVRSINEVGHVGFSVFNALTPMLNMGQQLLEPPDVNGWTLGPAWFSTAGMLSRMNFASTIVTNQKFELRAAAQEHRSSPEALVDYVIGRLSIPTPDPNLRGALVDYARAGGWTGSDAQLLDKTGGLFHLLVGSGSYQFV